MNTKTKVMRLDKYLADGAIGTRSQVKKIIKEGRITVNDAKVKDAGLNINPASDIVTFDGQIISYSEFEYYMLNKPAGLISQSRKNSLKRGEKALITADAEYGNVCAHNGASNSSYIDDSRFNDDSVVDLITESGKIDLFPCGRLDKDTEGLLLITNDGKLAHGLLSPKHHVEKTYYAELSGELPESDIIKLEKGIDIGDEKPTLPAKVTRVENNREYIADLSSESAFYSSESVSASCITITEGRYHQVKRMFEAVGLKVTYLKRISFGPLTLDPDLAPGDYRALTEEELNLLRNR